MADASVSTSNTPSPAIPGLDDVAAPPDIEALVAKAQELMRNIDALTSSSSSSPAGDHQPTADQSRSSAPSAEPQTIAELDQLLSASADALLKADAPAIETLLDNVFEEKAAIVQKLGQPEAPAPPAIVQQQQAEAPPAPAPAPEPVAPVVEVAIAPPPPPPAPAQVVAAPEPVVKSQVEVAPAPERPMHQAPVVLKPIEQPVMVETRSSAPAAGVGARLGLISKPLMATLIVMNAPLRLVPRPLRPAVDWLAISLIAWVPIVWIMVLTLGDGQPPADTRHAATPDAHEEAEHHAPSHKSTAGSHH